MPKKKKEIIDKLALKGSKLSKRERMVPKIVILIIFITLAIFLRPILSTIEDNKKKLKENRKILSDLTFERKTLEGIQNGEMGAKLGSQFDIIEKYLPSSKPSLSVLLNLTALARLDGVDFYGMTLNPGKVKDEESEKNGGTVTVLPQDASAPLDKLKSYELELSINGDKDKVYKFISDLKEISPMMKIQEITTGIDLDRSGSGINMQATFKLIVYYQEVNEEFIKSITKLDFITDEEMAMINNLNRYLYNTDRFKTIDAGIYGVVVGVANPFGKSR